jgi:polyisoprenoid-binding protein YceI
MKTKIFLILAVLLTSSIQIVSAEYNVKKSDKNIVKFLSDAPIENFEGITNNIDGFLYFENDLTNNSQLHFEVDLRTIDTGIGLRNRHMRENYLETDKYPMAVYEGKIVNAEKVGENKYKVKVSGNMNIHGVSIPQDIEGTIELVGDEIYINSDFIVKLTDHKIDVPSLMFMKINENMQMHLDFTLEKVK